MNARRLASNCMLACALVGAAGTAWAQSPPALLGLTGTGWSTRACRDDGFFIEVPADATPPGNIEALMSGVEARITQLARSSTQWMFGGRVVGPWDVSGASSGRTPASSASAVSVR